MRWLQYVSLKSSLRRHVGSPDRRNVKQIVSLFIALVVFKFLISKKFLNMPKTLKSGERQMVLKVKSFCERERRNKAPIIPLEHVRSRVAAMTG